MIFTLSLFLDLIRKAIKAATIKIASKPSRTIIEKDCMNKPAKPTFCSRTVWASFKSF